MTSPSKSHRNTPKNCNFVLGIDVGTTSVKVCLVNIDTLEASHKFVKDTLASTAKDVPTADLQVRFALINADFMTHTPFFDSQGCWKALFCSAWLHFANSS